jgi:hypothetical protein
MAITRLALQFSAAVTRGVTPRWAEGFGLHGVRAIRQNEVSATGIRRESAVAEIARIPPSVSTRRDGRVVDGGGLETQFGRSAKFAIFGLNSPRYAR